MRTKLGALAAHLAESGWLAALVVVPVYFDIRTVRVFEEEKALLIRSIALVVLFALVVWASEEGRWTRWRAALRLPLAKPALALAGAWLVATCLAIEPHVSFWGAYSRLQGLCTLLGYLIVFAALVALLRRRDQVDRLVSVALLASLPPALYTIVQVAGTDPIRWLLTDVRPTSTAGNSIFSGAFLVLVAPLIAARLTVELRALRESRGGRGRPALAVSALLLLLACVLLAIVLLESRGPILGLIAGLVVAVTAFATIRKNARLLAVSLGGAAAAVAFLAVLNVPGGPLQPLREVPYLDRFGQITGQFSYSTQVRLIVWQSATKMLAANPWRALVGWGPDSAAVAFRPYLDPSLGRYEGRNVVADRMHNELLDAWVMTGLVGLLAELAVFCALFLLLLRRLGLVRGRRQAGGFLAVLAAAGLGGAALACWLDGGPRLAAPGFALGLLAGLLAWLVSRVFIACERPRLREDDLLLIALLGGVSAHFAELQTGIAVDATRLYFWAYAGLAVALATGRVEETPPAAPSPRPPAPPLLRGGLLTIAPTVGLVLVVSIANFYHSGFDPSAHAGSLAVLCAGPWLLGAALLAAAPGERMDWLPRLGAYAAMTAGLCLLFFVVYRPWASLGPVRGDLSAERIRLVASRASMTVVVVYGYILFVLVLQAFVAFLRDERGPLPLCRPPRARCAAYALLAIAGLAWIAHSDVRSSRADVASKHGFAYEALRLWSSAVAAHRESLRLEPAEDRYAMNLGRAWMERARNAETGSAEQRHAFERSRAALREARRLAPHEPDHARNLGRLHRLWWQVSRKPQERETHAAAAEKSYERQVEMTPRNPAAWNELATFHFERGDAGRALAEFDRSLELDDTYVTTLWLRGNTLTALGRLEDAIRDYDRALAVEPTMLPALSAKAVALARLGRADEAIVATQLALEIAPTDAISRYNLAQLYLQTGRTELARREIESGLAEARGDDRKMLERLREEVETGRTEAESEQPGPP